MKAILVINEMPSACNVCDFNRFASIHWGCSVHNNDSVTNEMEKVIRPSWCPLQPLPNKKEENDDGTHFSWRSNDWWSAGWNACLEEIEK